MAHCHYLGYSMQSYSEASMQSYSETTHVRQPPAMSLPATARAEFLFLMRHV
jgi:hypothetical protein